MSLQECREASILEDLTMKRSCLFVCLFLFGIQIPAYAFHANDPARKPVATAQSVTYNPQFVRYEIGFDFKLWLGNAGTMGRYAWMDSPPNGLGCEYPENSGIEHLFGMGPWIGALVDTSHSGTPRYVHPVTTGYEGWSGPLQEMFGNPDGRDTFMLTSIHDVGTPNEIGWDDDGDGKIDEDELDGFDNDGDWSPLTDDVGSDGLMDIAEVGCKGGFDPVHNPDPANDNWDSTLVDSCTPDRGEFQADRFLRTQGNGYPNHGEPHVDEDYGAVSEMDAYVGYADVYGNPGPVQGHVPLGLRVWQRAYAWNSRSLSIPVIFLDFLIINTGRYDLDSVFVGMLTDFDLGPTNAGGYFDHNIARYDSATRMSYAVNVIDRPTTPAGLSLLDLGVPSESLAISWRALRGMDSPTPDRARYSSMASGIIGPSMNADEYDDIRTLSCAGPRVLPRGDTLRMVWAFLSGDDGQDLKANAHRVQQIYDAHYFLPPVLTVKDSGNGTGALATISHLGNSGSGQVTGYRLRYAATDQLDEDTLFSGSPWIGVPDLSVGMTYYFVAEALDQWSNVSAPSDYVFLTVSPADLPAIPREVSAQGEYVSISIRWAPSSQVDVHRWNIHRYDSIDTTRRKLNGVPLTYPQFLDDQVRGGRVYYYQVTALDDDGNESGLSVAVPAELPGPYPTSIRLVIPGKNTIGLTWQKTNGPLPVIGYNVYRGLDSVGIFERRNTEILGTEKYLDTVGSPGTTYYYYVEVVDSMNSASRPSPIRSGHTVPLDGGILVVNATGFAQQIARKDFYEHLLRGYNIEIVPRFDASEWTSVYTMGQYSTVLWLQDTVITSIEFPFNDATSFASYALGGGNLLIQCSGLAENISEYFWLSAGLMDVFNTTDCLPVRDPGFIEATGTAGFPTLPLDPVKTTGSGGRLANIAVYPYALQSQVTHTYKSDPYDWMVDGLPVGIRAADTSCHAFMLGVPLFAVDSTAASNYLRQILEDFGELTAVRGHPPALPTEYCLHAAYPNPFNPSTTVRYDLPATSDVKIAVYDVVGRQVELLFSERQEAGTKEVVWNAGAIASGIYFIRFEAVGTAGSRRAFSQTGKLLLVK
jgi:hypothetical protein